MEQQDIHNYLRSFFSINHCEIFEDDGKSLHIQLTEELDKRLMNRPFYWRYIKNTNITPQPMTLTLVTDHNDEEQEGERIHFGSPRLHQIFRTTREMARHIRLFENARAPVQKQVPLEPWLGLNIAVSYQCDRKKDRLVSMGLHLIDGRIIDHFHDHLTSLNMTPKIPDYCFTLTPLTTPQSGLRRLQSFIEDNIHGEDHTWAEEARERWRRDLDLLDQFYENRKDDREQYETEKEALRQQYEPHIKVHIVGGGLFYLTKQAFTAS